MFKNPTVESFVGIIGIDGEVPTYDPTARWTTFEHNEIYFGLEGKNKYVPKLDDHVKVKGTNEEYYVVFIDPITFIPSLAPVLRTNDVDEDSLIAYSDQNWVLYYDRTTDPYTICVDGMITVNVDEAMYARIYRGIVPNESQIISMVYDNSGKFITNNITLESSIDSGYDIRGIKGVPSCHTNVDLKDGETCLLVIYTASGKILNKSVLRVDETTFIVGAFTNRRMITGISMKSAFIDQSNPTTVMFPVNLTTESFQPIGVVHYNNGDVEEHVVDGTKFTLYGLNSLMGNASHVPLINTFGSQTVGYKQDLVLAYNKDPNVGTTMDQGVDPNVLSVPYELIVSEPKRSYGVKLYSYPVWLDEINGYRLRHWMVNLDRDMMIDVTSEVSISANSDPFYPKAYGYLQRITFSINLASVSPTYRHFLHTQTTEIVLRARADEDYNDSIWEVSSRSPFYGQNIRAVLHGNNNEQLDISNKLANVEEFLEATYDKTNPLIDPALGTEPPRPTHMIVQYEQTSKLIKIEDFNKLITLKPGMLYYNNVVIAFLQKVVDDYNRLSVIEMTIRQ